MPRTVDPVIRRQQLAEAVWRVIRRDGLAAASVRAVAREAGLSAGSLRHYFGTQSELRAFAMRLVTQRVLARIEALDPAMAPRQRVQAILEELLPLDRDRRTEMEVWLAFAGQALVDPSLRRLRAEAEQLLLDGCRNLLAALVVSGDARPELDLDLEAERLNAVVDGVALHAMSRPRKVPARVMRAVVEAHLDSLRPSQGSARATPARSVSR